MPTPNEFWENQEWNQTFNKYLTGGGVATATPDTGLNVAGLQESAIAPMRSELATQMAGITSRLSKTKQAQSGLLAKQQSEALGDYLNRVGAKSSEVALQVAQMNQQQQLANQNLAWQKEATAQAQAQQWAQWERAQQFQEDATWKNFELEAKKIGISETELADKKEMFYSQMQQNSEQFNRSYTLQETIAMDKAKQEWASLGMTQQQIDQHSKEFDLDLKWQKDQFGKTFSLQETKTLNDIALGWAQHKEGVTLDYAKIAENARQFDIQLKTSADLDQQKIDLASRQQDLDELYRTKQIDLETYNNQTNRIRADNELVIAQMQNAYNEARMQLEANAMFGYWDEGYGDQIPKKDAEGNIVKDARGNIVYEDNPNAFKGNKYDLKEDGTINRTKDNPTGETQEWKDYQSQYYHLGDMDYKQLEMLFGLKGTTERTMQDVQNEIKYYEKLIKEKGTWIRSGPAFGPGHWEQADADNAQVAKYKEILDELNQEILNWGK